MERLPFARELWRIPNGLCDKFQLSPVEPQRKRKPRSAIGLFKLLASKHGSQFVFSSFGTFDLSAIQVCNPPEICQAHSQYPPHSRVGYPAQRNPQFNVIAHPQIVTLYLGKKISFTTFTLQVRLSKHFLCSSKFLLSKLICLKPKITIFTLFHINL